jgi:hypothetical protein
MKIQFRLLLETIALTALIWTYADQASYENYDGVLAVRIATPPDVVARIEGGRGGPTEVLHIPMKVRGPKAAIRKLEMEKGAANAPFLLNLPISDDPEMQVSYTTEIQDAASRLPAIRDRGLKLEELSRPTIVFTLDRYVSRTLNVEADPGKFGEALDGKPAVQPKQVTVKVLESELKKRGALEPRLVIPIEERLRARAEEFRATFDVPLGSKWEGMDAIFNREQVRVTVTLAKLYERVHLTLIPLRVMLPPGVFAGNYQIEWQTDADLVQDIDVRVPIGKPRALTNTEVLAFIQIDKCDLPADSPISATTAPAGTEGWSQREIHFVFPTGFEDVQVDGPPRMVKYRVKPKTSTSELTPLSELP